MQLVLIIFLKNRIRWEQKGKRESNVLRTVLTISCNSLL